MFNYLEFNRMTLEENCVRSKGFQCNMSSVLCDCWKKKKQFKFTLQSILVRQSTRPLKIVRTVLSRMRLNLRL